MAAATLQRELDAYADAINKYNRQARNYKTQVNQHNAAVDAYKASFVSDNKGEIGVFRQNRSGYFVPNTRITLPLNADSQYNRVDFGNQYYGFQYKDKPATKPGEFKMSQPTQPGNAPSATPAQIKKLDQPSLTDIERSGLISSAFNF